jgi:hypothetical protein
VHGAGSFVETPSVEAIKKHELRHELEGKVFTHLKRYEHKQARAKHMSKVAF